MNVTFQWDVGGVMQTLDAIVGAVSDLKRPLARMGGHLRSKAERRFRQGGPGWQDLAASTKARKIDKYEVMLLAKTKGGKSGISTVLTQQRKIGRQLGILESSLNAKKLKKAMARLGMLEAEGSRWAKDYSRGRVKFASFAALVAYAEKERRREKIHGAAMRAAKDIPLAPGESIRRYQYRNKRGQIRTATTIDNPSLERRRTRAKGKRRYIARDESTRILGSLSNSIALRFDGPAAVVVYSKARIGAIHNAGGTAGHGARIPKRPFLFLEAGDGKVFAEIVEDCIGEAIRAAA